MARSDSCNSFIAQLKAQLNLQGRQVWFNCTTGSRDTMTVFINLINLPEGMGSAGGGAERENNRILFSVDGFSANLDDPQPPTEKVKMQVLILSVTDDHAERTELRKFRGKTATPEKIAKYLADFINKVVEEISPRFTHSKPA